MERIIRVTLESTWDLPDELSVHKIDILQYSNGCYFSKFKKLDHAGELVTVKNELPNEVVTDILELLPTIRIPAFPRHYISCDGAFTEVEVGVCGGKSHFRWWGSPPDGWEILEQLAVKVIECSGFDDSVETDNSPTHEFRPLCSKCGEVASTFQLFNEFDKWRLVYEGSCCGNGSGGDEIAYENVRAIINGLTQPYTTQGIRSVGFYDDGGFCLECEQFYCSKHWHISTTGGGTCPNGHFKSLDPHWSPE